MFFRKLVSLGLVFLFLCLPAYASADEVPATEVNSNIVTEYNSVDLKDPIVFDATETVAGVGEKLEIPAKSCILMEVNTGEILYESESHLQLPPASITKVMALLLVMEAIDSGQLSLDTMLTASPYACSMGGSQIWLEPNEQMSVNDLLKAAVIGSANDATVMLGEALAGSEESFVSMMNERAGQLGLTDTTFINSTGLDADGHVTSAHDIAVMSRELIKHDLIKNYSTVWMDSLRNGESELVNTNKLVRFYKGCTGLKTGTTSGAGACLSATAERDGLELVAVVMGAGNSNDRFNGARKLLDYGFANYTFVTVTAPPEDLHEIPISGGTLNRVTAICTEKKGFLIEKKNAKTLTTQTELPNTLKAPISEGQQIGVTRVFSDGREIGTVKIVAKEEVRKITFGFSFKILLKNIFYV
ncbi:MAG: D-alanyl-D-alanine carboxypeptidase [Clostridia bacterium]|nr:D-alanyl-D-alanine carboxypeptidase [Clostridia bacterium]